MIKKLLWRHRVNMVIVLFAFLGFFIFSSFFTYLYFASDLKSKESIMNRNSTGIILTDRNGEPFFTFYSAYKKTFVPLKDIPDHTKNAVIAAEDKEFYSHTGFSVEGITRALIKNATQQEIVSGGSTITQQLVKNALLTPKRDVLRKFQEVILAQEIERRFTKDEILEMYLNSVYFGNGAFGIEEASQRYFGKASKDLTLAESSMLAGLLPAPSALSPQEGHIDEAKERQKYVLENMQEMNVITDAQKEKAYAQNLVFSTKTDEINSTAPHFAVMVRNELIGRYGEEKIIRSGYKVKTSIDLSMQKYAEEVVAQEVEKLQGNNVSNGAAVVIDPKSGEILALVGSKDWYDEEFGKVNVAVQTRQPGSSFKPVVYALAMEEKIITPATVLHDKPTTFVKNYKPENYDKKFRGNVLVRRALANSLNVPAVEVMTKLEMNEVLSRSKEIGITTFRGPEHYGPSLALGTGEVKLTELTNVYATLANSGKMNPVTSIIEVTDKVGKPVYKYTPQPKQVISGDVAFLISSILSDNKARSEIFGNTLTISRTAAVKTGTTENYRDAWTMGYTPQLAVGVWVGNNDGEPMDQVAGSLGAAPIWKNLMEKFHEDKPKLAFEKPNTVVAQSICGNTEYFLSGTRPTQRCPLPRVASSENDGSGNKENEPVSDEVKKHREVVRQLLEQQKEERRKAEDDIRKKLDEARKDSD